jgi:hypothetical protein
LRHVDAHLFRVPQAFAHMDLHHFADGDAARGAHLQGGVVAAFERGRRFLDPRDLHLLARQEVELRGLDLAEFGRKIDRALVHLLAERLVD